MMHRVALYVVALCGLLATAMRPPPKTIGPLTRFSFSNAMLMSIMERKQGIVSSGAPTSTLESGFLALAMENTMRYYPTLDKIYTHYLDRILDTVSLPLGNETKDAQMPLDRFSVATAIFDSDPDMAGVSAIQTSAFLAMEQSLGLQPRNADGGLWYYVYPNWSYLDGMFSLLPYMSLYGYYTKYMQADDIKHQIRLLAQHCAHPSGLLVHGYDFSRTAVWANKETGGSPYVWSRSLGWFVLGLVQTYERLDCGGQRHTFGDYPRLPVCDEIKNTTVPILKNLINYAHPEHGVWWQLTTLGGSQGNFLESSGTALFTAALFKAIRVGMVKRRGGTAADFRRAAFKAYGYMVQNFLTWEEDGSVGYNMTVSVCSLNSTASYDYYTTRPIVENGLLGEAAFVLASLERERVFGLKCEYSYDDKIDAYGKKIRYLCI
ncbi:Unsaturated rhamnogalacturonyl hydrolase YteR [Cladobotryum mycophilum]|uniref:Unsaturated rhamnogalacturonyl hydrolase YteR n=1 Tax=Cladobotryum mycophilum TaxID=491253 RepID=A0ABR0SVG0_9HYPO